jgi:hypothetical protein
MGSLWCETVAAVPIRFCKPICHDYLIGGGVSC